MPSHLVSSHIASFHRSCMQFCLSPPAGCPGSHLPPIRGLGGRRPTNESSPVPGRGEGGPVAPCPGALGGGVVIDVGVCAAHPAVVVVGVRRQHRVHRCGGQGGHIYFVLSKAFTRILLQRIYTCKIPSLPLHSKWQCYEFYCLLFNFHLTLCPGICPGDATRLLPSSVASVMEILPVNPAISRCCCSCGSCC